jgi:hypothetical protein
MADVFRILDIPAVPEVFVKECLDAVHDRLGLDIIQQKGGFKETNADGTFKFSELTEAPDITAYRKYVDNYQNSPKFVQWYDNTERRICAIKRFPFSDDLMLYVRENVFAGIDQVPKLQIGHQIWFGGEVIWPHSDGIRDGLLMYLIEPGGDNVVNKWWKHKEKSINTVPDTHYFKFEDLEEVTEVRIPSGKWCLMNTNVLHSVENIVGNRISLTIGLKGAADIRPFLEQHKLNFRFRG